MIRNKLFLEEELYLFHYNAAEKGRKRVYNNFKGALYRKEMDPWTIQYTIDINGDSFSYASNILYKIDKADFMIWLGRIYD